MKKQSATTNSQIQRRFTADYIDIFYDILRHGDMGLPRVQFVSEVADALVAFSKCDILEIRFIERDKLFRVIASGNNDQNVKTRIIKHKEDWPESAILRLDIESDFEQICGDISNGLFDPSLPYYTKQGSFFVGNTDVPLELSSQTCKWAGGRSVDLEGDFSSLAIIGFRIGAADPALLIFKSDQKEFFSSSIVEGFEEIARAVGIASSHRRTQEALRERVKELTCLYNIARVAARPDISLELLAKEVLEFLPPGWFYPEIAAARIVLDGKIFATPDFRDEQQKLTANIVVNNVTRGTVAVAYVKEMQELDEGPFLKEERNLIDAVADELALIIERRNIQAEQRKLQEQLRHADRLATIGQLAAGVAHELNEPLGSILGFAQLAKKTLEKPDQVMHDIEKIENASLHAREVVKKLMLFARQTVQQKTTADLNQIIEDGLYFLESRCAKAGIKLLKNLGADLPEIVADKSQIYQVLINLVVNAIQAMPAGGSLIISTAVHVKSVSLAVKDTGMGIKEELLEKVFIPFFTTKDVN
ncbi:MAG: sensor histidine kinase, partial [Planctomycetota bacterium]